MTRRTRHKLKREQKSMTSSHDKRRHLSTHGVIPLRMTSPHDTGCVTRYITKHTFFVSLWHLRAFAKISIAYQHFIRIIMYINTPLPSPFLLDVMSSCEKEHTNTTSSHKTIIGLGTRSPCELRSVTYSPQGRKFKQQYKQDDYNLCASQKNVKTSIRSIFII